jgi:hypothetical protein
MSHTLRGVGNLIWSHHKPSFCAPRQIPFVYHTKLFTFILWTKWQAYFLNVYKYNWKKIITLKVMTHGKEVPMDVLQIDTALEVLKTVFTSVWVGYTSLQKIHLLRLYVLWNLAGKDNFFINCFCDFFCLVIHKAVNMHWDLKKCFKIVLLSPTVQAPGAAGFIIQGDTVRRTKSKHAKVHRYKWLYEITFIRTAAAIKTVEILYSVACGLNVVCQTAPLTVPNVTCLSLTRIFWQWTGGRQFISSQDKT